MIEISNIKVYDLAESVIASGNAMRTEPVGEYNEDSEEFKKGLLRMQRLKDASLSGNVRCHHNALTGIRVSFDIKYPQYWSPEFQRYHFADIVTSSSKMHRLCKMDLRKACNKYVDPNIIKIEQEKIRTYNCLSELKKEGKATEEEVYHAFMEMISNCPLGLELFMRVSTNYMQLQTIYFQRRHHRLKEDWGAVCDMIEQLPYAKELILNKTIEQ